MAQALFEKLLNLVQMFVNSLSLILCLSRTNGSNNGHFSENRCVTTIVEIAFPFPASFIIMVRVSEEAVLDKKHLFQITHAVGMIH